MAREPRESEERQSITIALLLARLDFRSGPRRKT